MTPWRKDTFSGPPSPSGAPEELASCGHGYSENWKHHSIQTFTNKTKPDCCLPPGLQERARGVGSLELRAGNSPRSGGTEITPFSQEEKPCLCRGQQQGSPVKSLESQKASLVQSHRAWPSPRHLSVWLMNSVSTSLRPGGRYQALSECAVSGCSASPRSTHPAPVCWPA